MKKIILIFLVILLATSTNFDITSTSTCTNFTSGFCTKWEQTGTVQEQMGSCFPANTQVIGKLGPIKMKDLKKGDEILGWIDEK